MKNFIIIKNLKIFSYHGVKPEEKVNGQNFFIDVKIGTEKLCGYETDVITDVLSYSTVVKKIVKWFGEQSFDLIEKAAEYVAKKLFETFEEIKTLTLTVKKPDAPVSGVDFEYVAVEISRERSDYIA